MFLRSDGFDHYVAKDAPANALSAYLTSAGYVVRNPTNNTFAISDGMDTGSLALKMTINQGSATPPSLSYTVNSEGNLVVFGFAFRGSGARLRIARIDNIADIDWDQATGRIKIGNSLGANVIILNAWWYIEVEIDKTAGKMRVYANDTFQIETELPPDLGNQHTITWGLTSTSMTTGTIELDDFYVVDDTPGQNTSRLGPVAIITRVPTSDVEAEWSIVGTSNPNHYEIAAQLDPGRANAPYLQSNVIGKRDIFASNVVLPNDNQVYAVSVVTYARKGDLDDRAVGLVVKTDGGELEISKPLTEAYQFHQAVFEQAPGQVPWNQSRVETSQFGIVSR